MPTALAAKSRRRWFIAGGGDGPAIREACAFPEAEEIVCVDISRTVKQSTQIFAPSFWGDAARHLATGRLTIIHRDMFAVAKEMVTAGRQFDIGIFDLTDREDDEYTPFEKSTADHLYTDETVALFKSCMTPGAIVGGQFQECSRIRSSGHMEACALFERHFRYVRSYRIFIDFFGYWEGFLIASDEPVVETFPHRINAERLLDPGFYMGTLAPYFTNDIAIGLAAIPRW